MDSDGNPKAINIVSDKTESLSINLNLDFYNTSALSPKMARDIKFRVKRHGNNIVKRLRSRNSIKNNPFSSYDDLININLSPKQIQNYELTFSSDNNFQAILNADWFIEFRNNNDRIKKNKINKKYQSVKDYITHN